MAGLIDRKLGLSALVDADGRSSGPVATLVQSPADDSRNPDWACSLRHHKRMTQRYAQIDWHLFRLALSSCAPSCMRASGPAPQTWPRVDPAQPDVAIHRVDRTVDRLHFDERGEGVLGNTNTMERLRAMVDNGCFRSRRLVMPSRRVADRRRSCLVRRAVANGSLLRRAPCHTDGSCWSICWGPSRSR